jgi:prepilin-type N-terminal cleavage/methylation domain-containing protein/prepilin-type processing-associated H-X9-DG protein
MKRKGFTLIELLVVISIIALLMSILMPALARVRELASRVVCGTNLSGIGKAMGIYANNNESGRFPRAGGRNSILGPVTAWAAVAEADAFTGSPPTATITSSLWLLVRGDYATAKQFVCGSDPDTEGQFRTTDPYSVWDFGDTPVDFCSYAYHMPYDDAGGFSFGMTSASNPGLPVAADRNPGVELDLNDESTFNSRAHQDEGQNVLFVDGHVSFERTEGDRPGRNCGLNDDDIYSCEGTNAPIDRYDSYLIN